MNWDSFIIEFIIHLDEEDISYQEGLDKAILIADDLMQAAESRKVYAR